jgi:hypothetical protein
MPEPGAGLRIVGRQPLQLLQVRVSERRWWWGRTDAEMRLEQRFSQKLRATSRARVQLEGPAAAIRLSLARPQACRCPQDFVVGNFMAAGQLHTVRISSAVERHPVFWFWPRKNSGANASQPLHRNFFASPYRRWEGNHAHDAHCRRRERVGCIEDHESQDKAGAGLRRRRQREP